MLHDYFINIYRKRERRMKKKWFYLGLFFINLLSMISRNSTKVLLHYEYKGEELNFHRNRLIFKLLFIQYTSDNFALVKVSLTKKWKLIYRWYLKLLKAFLHNAILGATMKNRKIRKTNKKKFDCNSQRKMELRTKKYKIEEANTLRIVSMIYCERYFRICSLVLFQV